MKREIFNVDESADVHQILVEGVASTGLGAGHVIEEGFKRPVFVPYTVPGDIIEVRKRKKIKKYYEAELIRIIKKSPFRREPVCPYFKKCGACDFLHITYEKQLEIKKNMLLQYFVRNKLNFDKIKVLGTKSEYNYRVKARFTAARFVEKKRSIKGLGFFKEKSNTVVQIENCHLIHVKINDFLKKIEQRILRNQKEIIIAYDKKTDDVRLSLESKKCYYSVAGLNLAFYPDSFVQSNSEMNEVLVNTVLENSYGKKILELYGGNGNITIPLAKKNSNSEITSVEGDKKGYSLICDNLTEHEIENVNAINDDVKRFLKFGANKNYDLIILDPPRSGASEVLELIAQKTKKIIYVSCDAQVLAKEIKQYLCLGFVLQKVYLIDMFPNTKHFETVVVMEKS